MVLAFGEKNVTAGVSQKTRVKTLSLGSEAQEAGDISVSMEGWVLILASARFETREKLFPQDQIQRPASSLRDLLQSRHRDTGVPCIESGKRQMLLPHPISPL